MGEKLPFEVHYVCDNCGSMCHLDSLEYEDDGKPLTGCPYLNGDADWKLSAEVEKP